MNTTKKLMTLGLVALLLVGCAPKEDKVDKVTPDEETQIATENPAEETPSEETPVVEEEKEETPKEEEKKEEDKTASTQTSKPAETKPASKPSTTKPAESKPASKPSTTAPAKDVVTKKTETITLSKIAFTITYKDDANLDKGKEQVITNGVDGAKMQEVEITYTNGKETSRKVIRTYDKAPVNKVVARGTKVAAAPKLIDSSGLLANINALRAANGLATLEHYSSMKSIAEQRVQAIYEEYLATGTISHKGATQMENIHFSGSNMNTDMNHIGSKWTNSAGHKANRLNVNMTHYGSAVLVTSVGIFAVEVLI